MANVAHSTLTGAELHPVPRWTVANAAARLALSVTAADIDKYCHQTDNDTYYALTNNSPMTWAVTSLAVNTDGTGLTNVDDSHTYTSSAISKLMNALASGLTPHADCNCGTTGALPAGTYNNGAGGVGATFTVTATGTLTVDGHLVVLNNRVLVKNQADATQNGVYLCTTAGAVGVQAVLTRATDSDSGAALLNALYAVTAGTTNGGTQWYVTNSTAPSVGTDAINFAQLQTGGNNGNGVKVAAPLSKSGNTIGLGAIDSTTAKTTPVDADETILADSAASFVAKKVTFLNAWANYFKGKADALYAITGRNINTTAPLAGGGDLSADRTLTLAIDSATAKTTPVDADELALADSAASFVAKKVTMANVKTYMGVPAAANPTSTIGATAVNGSASTFMRSDGAPPLNIAGLTAKTTPVGADVLVMADSAASNALKAVTLTQAAANMPAITTPDVAVSGLTGAATASRYVGGVAGAAPTSGTFAVGDWVTDTTLGGVWTCTVAGTPGTWTYSGPSIVANNQTDNYTTVLADAGKLIEMNKASAVTLTIPANSSVAYPVGSVIQVYNMGAGQVTVAVTTDTLRAPNGAKLAKQFSVASVWKRATTEWVISGDTSS